MRASQSTPAPSGWWLGLENDNCAHSVSGGSSETHSSGSLSNDRFKNKRRGGKLRRSIDRAVSVFSKKAGSEGRGTCDDSYATGDSGSGTDSDFSSSDDGLTGMREQIFSLPFLFSPFVSGCTADEGNYQDSLSDADSEEVSDDGSRYLRARIEPFFSFSQDDDGNRGKNAAKNDDGEARNFSQANLCKRNDSNETLPNEASHSLRHQRTQQTRRPSYSSQLYERRRKDRSVSNRSNGPYLARFSEQRKAPRKGGPKKSSSMMGMKAPEEIVLKASAREKEEDRKGITSMHSTGDMSEITSVTINKMNSTRSKQSTKSNSSWPSSGINMFQGKPNPTEKQKTDEIETRQDVNPSPSKTVVHTDTRSKSKGGTTEREKPKVRPENPTEDIGNITGKSKNSKRAKTRVFMFGKWLQSGHTKPKEVSVNSRKEKRVVSGLFKTLSCFSEEKEGHQMEEECRQDQSHDNEVRSLTLQTDVLTRKEPNREEQNTKQGGAEIPYRGVNNENPQGNEDFTLPTNIDNKNITSEYDGSECCALRHQHESQRTKDMSRVRSCELIRSSCSKSSSQISRNSSQIIDKVPQTSNSSGNSPSNSSKHRNSVKSTSAAAEEIVVSDDDLSVGVLGEKKNFRVSRSSTRLAEGMQHFNIYEYEEGEFMEVVYDNFGPNPMDLLYLKKSDFVPRLNSISDVVVKVEASTVSFSDCLIRLGKWWGKEEVPFPITPGVDVVGRIHDLAPETMEFHGLKPNDLVASLIKWGGNARYATINAHRLVPVPENVDTAEAVCLIETHLAAFQAIHLCQGDRIRYRKNSLKGKQVLIIGGESILSQAMIQLSLLAGASTVYATADQRHWDHLRSVGAMPLDSDPDRWLPKVRGEMDLVVDAYCFDSYDSSRAALNSSGILVCVGMKSITEHEQDWLTPVEIALTKTKMNLMSQTKTYELFEHWEYQFDLCKRDLAYLFQLLLFGIIKPNIVERIRLSEVPRAQEKIETYKVPGLIVCEPWMKQKRRAVYL